MSENRSRSFLQFAILGCGRHAQQKFLHIDRYIKNIRLSAVFDRDEKTLELLKRERRNVLTTTSLDMVLDQRTPDFVIIASTPETHFELAAICIEKNVHVLLEKPMTATLEQARRLKSLVERQGVLLMVGHHRRFGGPENKIKSLIESGRLGEIISIQVTHNYNDESRRPMSGYLQAGNDSLSGVLFEYMSHELDLLRHFFPGIIIEKVQCLRRSIRHKDDTAALQLQLSNGVIASYLLSSATTDLEVYRVFGTAGQVTFNRYRDPTPRCYSVEAFRNRPLRFLLQFKDGLENFLQLKYLWKKQILQAYIAELSYFTDCIREEKQPLCSVDEGLFVLEALEMIDRKL